MATTYLRTMIDLNSTEIIVTGLQPLSQYRIKFYMTDKSGQFTLKDKEELVE